MSPSFKDPARYASLHATPNGAGDARPTALQIAQDNDVIGKMQEKTFLITGGSNGLGVDIVRTLAKTGARIFFTARDVAKGEKVKKEILEEAKHDASLKGARLEIIKMDLQSLESVKAGADAFKGQSEKLNVLINNAGEHTLRQQPSLTSNVRADRDRPRNCIDATRTHQRRP